MPFTETCARSALISITLLLLPPLASSAELTGGDFRAALQYVDLGKGGLAQQILTDPAGTIVVVGMISDTQLTGITTPATLRSKILVARFDRDGQPLSRFIFGSSGYDQPTGAAIDSGGNIYITGSTLSPGYFVDDPSNSRNDFPLVDPLMPNTAGPAFVTKLDAAGSRLLFSTRLGGAKSLSFG